MLLSADLAPVLEAPRVARAAVVASGLIYDAAEGPVAPTIVQPTLVPAALSGVRLAEAGGARLRRVIPKTDGVSIVSRPSMLLQDQDGNLLSSSDPSVDSVFEGFGPDWSSGTTSTDPDPDRDAQAKELTPEGLALLPHLPWSQDSSFKGQMAADRSWISFTVPVGPNTNALRLAVDSEINDGSTAPARVDQVYLLDAGGNLMAAITGIAAGTTQSKQTLVVTLQSPPVGGLVVVRLISASSPSEAGGGSPPVAPDSGGGIGSLPLPVPAPSNPFTVEVQRNDGSPTTPGGSSASPPFIMPPSGSAGAGYANTPVGFGRLGSTPAVNPPGGGANIEPGYAFNTTNRSIYIGGRGVRVSTEPMELDSGAEPISLGPLVSRGAAPIGPVLATTIDDPAPSISRDQQGGRSADSAGLRGDVSELEWELRLDGADDRRSRARGRGRTVADGADDDLSPLTTLTGLGGLPSLVASFPRGTGRAQAQELAAGLQPRADLLAVDQGPASPADHGSADQTDDVARAGIATRAVGFAIALGLASGPLYPDLIAFARRRLRLMRRGVPGSLVRRRSLGPIA